MASSTTSLTSVTTRCPHSFESARSSRPAQRLSRRSVVAQSSQEGVPKKAVMSGLAALAAVPLFFGGPAVAFVGNTASDFTDKVDRYTPSPDSVNDVVSSKVEQATPDVPLPGLKQKGKEAAAIGKGGASGPGAKDQVKGAASDVADKTGADDVADKAKGALEDVKPKRGLFERINDEALTKNAPSVQQQSKSS